MKMTGLHYILIDEKFSICTGIENIINGIEINLMDLVLNERALELLNLVTSECINLEPDRTFKWYCCYLSQFFMTESKQRNKYYLTNPKVQIIFGDNDLLEKLKCVIN